MCRLLKEVCRTLVVSGKHGDYKKRDKEVMHSYKQCIRIGTDDAEHRKLIYNFITFAICTIVQLLRNSALI